MSKKIKLITLALAAVLALGAAAACNNSSGTGDNTESSVAVSTDNTASADEDSAEESVEESVEESSEGAAVVDLKTADYSNPAVTIEWGQFEEIKKLTEEMQTGKYDGQVIKVTGTSEKRMSSCTVMEKNEETGTSYGMTYYLDGQPDLNEYPAEDAKVELLGVVTVGEYEVRALTVLPENVKVLEEVPTA